MEKYIDVETVEVITRDWACCPEDLDAFMSEIGEASTSDVAPVRHGMWEPTHRPDLLSCSACHGAYLPEKWWKYCPVCGARMDGQDAAQ